MKANRFDVITLVALAATVVVTLAVYAKLPDPMPTHFNARGIPNGWMPRAIGAWVVPATAFGVWALARVFGNLLLRPGEPRTAAARGPLDFAIMLTALMLVAVHLLMLRAGLGSGQLSMKVPWLVTGGFLIALGQVLPRVRRNPIIGVRTPFSLTSDENWARTQRFASYSMTIGGVVAALAGVMGATGVALAAVIASACAPTVYSWVQGRGLPPAS